jgi:hypothetical protein
VTSETHMVPSPFNFLFLLWVPQGTTSSLHSTRQVETEAIVNRREGREPQIQSANQLEIKRNVANMQATLRNILTSFSKSFI